MKMIDYITFFVTILIPEFSPFMEKISLMVQKCATACSIRAGCLDTADLYYVLLIYAVRKCT